MRKVNSVIYNKLLIQAQEAKTQNLVKLASGIMNSLGPLPEDESVKYNYQEMHDEIYEGMWKLGMNVIKYYDVESADAQKIHDRLESLADRFIKEMELALGTEDVLVGPLEPKLAHYHSSAKNGYMDLKSGGYGVIVDTRNVPKPGDEISITLEDGTTVEEFVKEVLHVYPGKGGSPVKPGQLGSYLVSITSQEQAERINGPWQPL